MTDKAMDHAPGCGYFRRRPCNCAYLRSWQKDTEVLDVIDTPQNRYTRLRALVPKRTRNFEDDLARAVALDHHAHTTPHLPFRPDETGVRQIMAAASPYKKGPLASSARKYLTEHPEVLWRQVADDWQRKAEFYKTASLIFMGSAVLSAGCLFSKIVGWW